MSIKDELIQYCNDCINDKYVSEFEDYISCEKHKFACKRLLNDFERENTDSFPYFWNEIEAEKIVKWFTHLRHSKGVLAGKPINLTLWQKFHICQLYGWRNIETDCKRFTKMFIEVSRKNAKSQEIGGIILYEMSSQATKNNEVYETYSAGTRKEQSKIIFEECKLMLRGSPLAIKFKCGRDSIKHIKTGSFLKPLSKEDRKSGDGTNIAVLCLDEYHQHETTEYYDLFQGANTKESLLIIITTAGVNLSSPCFTQEYKYCSNILKGEVINESYLVDILECEECDDISDKRTWWKSNPIRMSYAEGVKKLTETYNVAVEVPEKMTPFLTKCCNMWQDKAINGYMDMDKYSKCVVKKLPDLEGKDVFVGVDLSAKTDLTAVTFEIPLKMDDGTVKFVIISRAFVPDEAKIREHQRVDKQPFKSWLNQGYVKTTNSQIVDQKVIIDYILDTCKYYNWNVKAICVDPHNSSLFVTTMSDMKYDVFEIYQSQKHLNEPTVHFREQIYCGNIIIEENPMLFWEFNNAVIAETNGYIKVDKAQSKNRIDQVDSTLCCHKLAMYHKFENKMSLDEQILSESWII